MIDEKKYLNGVRLLLKNRKLDHIANLLEGATCSISGSSDFSGKRWNCYYGIIYFYVRIEYLHEFTDEVKQILVDVADTIMPKEVELDVMEVAISPNLEEIPIEDGPLQLMLNGRNYISLFGSPSSDLAFDCDVFMIMPFAEPFEPVYKEIVVPTVRSLGLTIKRGDDPFSKHEIMHEIWSMLNACRLVIADCTGQNPNVFYELGIAHTIGRPVIMLTQNITEIPFDVRNRRAIQYDTTFHKIDELKRQLKIAVQSILNLEDGIPF